MTPLDDIADDTLRMWFADPVTQAVLHVLETSHGEAIDSTLANAATGTFDMVRYHRGISVGLSVAVNLIKEQGALANGK